jgi:hypothetical protein
MTDFKYVIDQVCKALVPVFLKEASAQTEAERLKLHDEYTKTQHGQGCVGCRKPQLSHRGTTKVEWHSCKMNAQECKAG